MHAHAHPLPSIPPGASRLASSPLIGASQCCSGPRSPSQAAPAWTRLRRRLTSLLALVLLPAGLLVAQAQTVPLRVLGLTDIHMHLLAWDYYQDRPTEEYGLARTVSLIKAARAEAPNTLLFDNGDLIQGSPLGDFVARVRPLREGELHPAVAVYNALGVDAVTLGNHEFNFGLPFLQRAMQGANFPWLSANLHTAVPGARPADEPFYATPHVILERRFTDTEGRPQTIRVGVIGLLPPGIMVWDRSHLEGRVTVRPVVEAARRGVARLRQEGADVVVAVVHNGIERRADGGDTENSVAGVARIPGVDAIIFGHSHGEFPGRDYASLPGADITRGTLHGVPAVMPGRWGDHLGVIDLVLTQREGAWRVSEGRGEIRPIRDRATRRALVEADPMVERLVADAHRGTLAYMRSQVATTRAPIHSYFAQVLDDPSVQLVSQAQLAYGRQAVRGTEHEGLPMLSAAAPFKNGGRQGWNYYTDIPAGPLQVRNIADLYIYPNTVRVLRLNGAEVREWLEMAAGQFNRIDPAGPPAQALINPDFRSYNFDTLDGLSYRIDVTQPARYDRGGRVVAPQSRRIVDLRHDGQPVRDEQMFMVVTNNYRANGGGSFPGLDGSRTVIESPVENREVLLQYLRDQREVDPRADGNWRIQPVPGISLRFTAGNGALPHLPQHPQIRQVSDTGDGSSVFELRP
jgi:2',3'-cyclic-nucleotide 2'-phosphodiesterase / 3'-nucleotidase